MPDRNLTHQACRRWMWLGGMGRVPIIAALATCVICPALAASPGADRFQFRTELWDFYQQDQDETDENQLILRNFQDVDLASGWGLTFREDVPFIFTNKEGTDNPNGRWAHGVGDAFIQAMFTTPDIDTDVSLSFGARLYFPTGGLSPFGTGQYQIGPEAAINFGFHDPAYEFELAPTIRYDKSFASAYEGSEPTRKLNLYPKATLKLASGWSFALWPENPIVYNNLTDEWFVPLDGMLSYRIGDHIAIGLGGSVELIDNDPQYKRMIYGHVDLRF